MDLLGEPLLTAEWVLGDGAPRIATLGGGVDAEVVIEATAMFGPLELAFSAGPFVVPADTCAELPFEVPAEAFLHARAADYVTDLEVRLVPTTAAGREETVGLPTVFAAWLAGAAAPPTVWDAEGLRQNAPLGVLAGPDLGFVAPAALGDVVLRIAPPINQELNRDPTIATDERAEHRTVPVAEVP